MTDAQITQPRRKPPPTHLVRCASHRARARLFSALRRQPQSFWHWDQGSNYGVYRVSAAELPVARAVKGVSHVRGDAAEWSPCWG